MYKSEQIANFEIVFREEEFEDGMVDRFIISPEEGVTWDADTRTLKVENGKILRDEKGKIQGLRTPTDRDISWNVSPESRYVESFEIP